MWDCSKIINILGHLGCLEIISAHKPPVDGDGSDRLVCNWTANGNYTVKKGYERFNSI